MVMLGRGGRFDKGDGAQVFFGQHVGGVDVVVCANCENQAQHLYYDLSR